MNADGSGQTRIESSAEGRQPAWSPDGRRIAFVSNRDGNPEIYVMNADGSAPTRLTNSPNIWVSEDIEPVWSPDGQRIVFVSDRDEPYDLYVMNADGSGQTRLTRDNARELGPAWSPDGSKIALSKTLEIWVMNPDGTQPVNLTNTPGVSEYSPSWSPNGAQIAFSSDRDGLNTRAIYVMNADGSGATRLTTSGRDSDPAWGVAAQGSHAPAQIAFTTQPPDWIGAKAVISPAVRVIVRDATGRPMEHVVVRIGIGSGPNPAATLSGTTHVEAIGGVATFDDLSIDQPGRGYSLLARVGPLSTSGASFTVVGPPTRLAFTAQPPATVDGGAPISPPVQVAVQDVLGTTVPNATTAVTIGWAANSSGATLSGTTTVQAVAGIATFADLRVDLPGSGYALAAAASGVAGTTSGSFAVQPFAFVGASTGQYHTCAVSATGAAYCWGSNTSGALGDGTMTPRAGPVPVLGGLRFSMVSAGPNHSCGVTTSGAAYCWGGNSAGQLGDGTQNMRTSPALVAGGLSFRWLTAGSLYTCGVTTDDRAYCWGSNNDGKLGDGTTTGRTSPVPVTGGLSFATLGAGYAHTCGVTTTNGAYCWGWNGFAFGQLGDGSTASRPTPGPVAGDLHFVTVAAGTYHSCGVTTDGAAYCWGNNGRGQLGDGTTVQHTTPTPVAGGLRLSAVTAGERHSCGLTTENEAFCWGDNWALTPTAVSGGLTFAAISAGVDTNCGVTRDGAVYCWGGANSTPVRVVP